MTFTKLSTALLMSTALVLSACNQADHATEATKDAALEKTDALVKDVTQKIIDYSTPGQTDADHLWLEDVTGEKALDKVKSWNSASEPKMQGDIYNAMKAELLEVYNSPEKIPYLSYRNGQAYNFWQDDKHVKGIWRRTTLDSYASDDPQWETVLDIDALAKTDDKNWVYKGNSCLGPDYTHCMVNLSIGGKDEVERREFNTKTKSFVKGGFLLPGSKGGTAWVDQDNLLVGVDFGEGTMTDSGYPMIAKLWARGTDLVDARELFKGEAADVGIFPGTIENADGEDEIVVVRGIQ